jgi:hypothetical protein
MGLRALEGDDGIGLYNSGVVGMTTAWIVAFATLCILVLALGVIVLGLLRQALPLIEQSQALIDGVRTRMRRFGLPAGMIVPAFTAETISGATLTDRDLGGRATAILFLSRTCPSCEQMFRDLAAGHVPDLGVSLVAVVDEQNAVELSAAEDAGVPVISQRRGSISAVFESDRVPHCFVLDEDAVVRATGSPGSWTDVLDLVSAAGKGGDTADHSTVAFAASTG